MGIGNSPIWTTLHMLHYLNLSKVSGCLWKPCLCFWSLYYSSVCLYCRQCLRRKDHCQECILKLPKAPSLKLFKPKMFVVCWAMTLSLGVPDTLARDRLHYTVEEALGEPPGPLPKASKPRTGDLWPVWDPGSFGSPEHFMYLRLSLPAFWGRCCSSQIPCWGDYMPKADCFFPSFLCFYQEGDSLAYDAFQRWYNITSGRLCPQSC